MTDGSRPRRLVSCLRPPLVALVLALAVALAVAGCPVDARAEATDGDGPMMAARVGWAYGLGGEVELRPAHWGIIASGGWVPEYGPGGYLGASWGIAPLGQGGVVAEAGLFYGQHSELRDAPDGLGAYLLAGRGFAPNERVSLRLVAGAGMPFATTPSWPTFEFLAKLTVGVVF